MPCAHAPLKAQLDGGLICDIVVLRGTGRWSVGEDWLRSGQVESFANPKQTPGGAMIDEGTSSLGRIRWLTGSGTVQVEVANLVYRDIEVEDWAMATFTFDNGTIATLANSWTTNSSQKTGSSPKQNGVIRIEIIGTRGEVIQERLRVPGMAVLAAGAPN